MADGIKSGIYEIVNLANGKRYVGSAVNLHKRWGIHRSALNNCKHVNRHLQAAWNKRGGQAFAFSVIEYCDKLALIDREQHYIDTLCPEYNLCRTAGSTLGTKRSSMTRARMRTAQLGKKHSAEALAKMSAIQLGRKHSTTTRLKMSAVALGKNKSAETRARMRAVAIAIGRKVPAEHLANRRGTKHSEETRAKMSAAAIGKKKSKETRANMRAAWARRKAASAPEQEIIHESCILAADHQVVG
jgi:group I intron endonuclease